MQERELSKFQIKAEITLMLQKLTSLEELSREKQVEYVSKLGSIKDRDYVLDLLCKELPRVSHKKGQILILFLQELGSLEQLSDIMWSYIKSPDSLDELRDLAGIVLKNLGDTTDPEEFLSYLENPKEIVDKETQKLLEVASVNPEAQIDFLDFLFSLPEKEQESLIQSLQDDYSSEHIAGIIIPVFESRLLPYMDDLLLKILGETKAPKAAAVLKEFIKTSENKALNKKVNHAIKTLRIAGIDIENIKITEGITKNSNEFEFYANLPDGLGNQAIIVSRERSNGDILMMNTVINDVHGILDCFGFYGISKSDFRRIVNKYQEKNTGIPVSAQYCKYLLDRSEKISKECSVPIPYEYLAWKSVLSDVEPIDFNNIEKQTEKWADKKYINEGYMLYKFSDFSHWFFEDEDHEVIKNALNKIIENIVEKKSFYTKNKFELEDYLETELETLMEIIFGDEIKDMYKYRLQNIAYLFDMDQLEHFRNISATLAWFIDPKNNQDISENCFFREIIKKTINEGLLRYQYNLYNEEKQASHPWNQRKKVQQENETGNSFEDQSIEEIIEILCGI